LTRKEASVAILKYSTPDGEILIETAQFAATSMDGMVAKGGDPMATVLDGGSFEAAIGRIKVIANAVAKTMYEIATTPETAEVELALKFSGKAGIILAESSAEAQLKVKLVWKPKPAAKN
jgi:Trypsin-co-occurring domain 1